MKRKIATAALSACLLLALCSCVDTKTITIATPDVSLLRDGTYEGEAKAGPVFARVTVRVESGRIVDFTIKEHRTMRGKAAESLSRLVVERQTLVLDAVSGATASSKAILKAGENALESAMK